MRSSALSRSENYEQEDAFSDSNINLLTTLARV